MGSSTGGEAASISKLAEKRESRVCCKPDHVGRKPAGREAMEQALSRASRKGRGEAETQTEEGSAGPRRAAGQARRGRGPKLHGKRPKHASSHRLRARVGRGRLGIFNFERKRGPAFQKIASPCKSSWRRGRGASAEPAAQDSRGEAGEQAAWWPAGSNRGRRDEAAGRTCMESAQSTLSALSNAVIVLLK